MSNCKGRILLWLSVILSVQMPSKGTASPSRHEEQSWTRVTTIFTLRIHAAEASYFHVCKCIAYWFSTCCVWLGFSLGMPSHGHWLLDLTSEAMVYLLRAELPSPVPGSEVLLLAIVYQFPLQRGPMISQHSLLAFMTFDKELCEEPRIDKTTRKKPLCSQCLHSYNT